MEVVTANSYTVYYIDTYDAFEDCSLCDYVVAKSRGKAKSRFVRDMRNIGYDVEWTQSIRIRKMSSFTDEADAIKNQDELRSKVVL